MISGRGLRRIVALGLMVIALAGCGIPLDAEPREISRDALPPELVDTASTQATVAGDAETRMVTFYMVRSDENGMDALVPIRTDISRPTASADLPKAVVEALVATRPSDLGQADLVNALSRDIQVRSAVVGDDGVLDLDLTDLETTEIAMQRLAIAQLVFTLTDLAVPQIDAVRFSVDGREVAVPVEGKVIPAGTPVRPGDEPSLVAERTSPTS